MKDILLLYSAALEDAWWMLQALRESRHAIYSEASNQLVACVPLLPSKCPYSHSQQASSRITAGASLTVPSLPPLWEWHLTSLEFSKAKHTSNNS